MRATRPRSSSSTTGRRTEVRRPPVPRRTASRYRCFRSRTADASPRGRPARGRDRRPCPLPRQPRPLEPGSARFRRRANRRRRRRLERARRHRSRREPVRPLSGTCSRSSSSPTTSAIHGRRASTRTPSSGSRKERPASWRRETLCWTAFEAFSTRYADPRNANDDTPIIRRLAEERPIHISPQFRARYWPRDTLRGFLKHAYHRGIVFLDGHGRRESAFFPFVARLLSGERRAVAVAPRSPRLLPSWPGPSHWRRSRRRAKGRSRTRPSRSPRSRPSTRSRTELGCGGARSRSQARASERGEGEGTVRGAGERRWMGGGEEGGGAGEEGGRGVGGSRESARCRGTSCEREIGGGVSSSGGRWRLGGRGGG